MSDPLDDPVFASCSLDAQGRRLRADELAALLVPNLVDLQRRPDGMTLALDLDAGALRDLARLLEHERECCSFWRFALTPAVGGPARLEVAVTEGHEPALQALAALVGGGRA